MSDLSKYKKINWINGMKINKEHLIGSDNHFTANAIDTRLLQLNEFNYGLVPTEDGSDNLKIDVVMDNQNSLRVVINTCLAISPGGFRIIIHNKGNDNSYTIPNIETEYDLSGASEKSFYLIISVDPYQRIPQGKADSKETPLRLPFVDSEYKVHLVPASQVEGARLGPNMLTIGKLDTSGNHPELVDSYIPPCINIAAHPKLLELYAYVLKNISQLEKNVVKIIHEINEKHDSNVLTGIVSHISESLLQFLSGSITNLNWALSYAPPIHTFEFVTSIARVLKNSYDTRTAEEKEVLLNYFSEHFDINPSRFKQLLDNTIGMSYDHTDINHSIEKTEDFINVIALLFNELSKMELIAGKRKKIEHKKIDIIIR
jgi:hypothetical protein